MTHPIGFNKKTLTEIGELVTKLIVLQLITDYSSLNEFTIFIMFKEMQVLLGILFYPFFYCIIYRIVHS